MAIGFVDHLGLGIKHNFALNLNCQITLVLDLSPEPSVSFVRASRAVMTSVVILL